MPHAARQSSSLLTWGVWCLDVLGFSGADVNALCREAAMGPIRGSLQGCNIDAVTASEMPPIRFRDFQNALKQVRPAYAARRLQGHLMCACDPGETLCRPERVDVLRGVEPRVWEFSVARRCRRR